MSFIEEFKRRNIFKVSVAYAIVAWLLIQVADTLLPAFEAPDWVLRVFALVVILGFPLAILLAWAFELTPAGIKATSHVAPGESIAPQTGLMLNFAILGLVVLAVGFLLLDRYAIGGNLGENTAPAASVSGLQFDSQASVQRLSLVLPREASITFGGSPAHSLAISPDGQTIAFVGGDSNTGPDQTRLFVRRLDSRELRELPGTEAAKQPFFSPDGQWLGFFNNSRELKKVSLAGGQAITLAEGLSGASWARGTWLANQQIVFSNHGDEIVIKRVPADGGEVTNLTELNAAANENRHIAPTAVPDTNLVLFTTQAQVENQLVTRLEALNTDTGERRLLLEGASDPHYLDSGHLLFNQDDVLLVAPFDKQRLAITGPAVSLTDAIRRDGTSSQGNVAQLAVSRTGTLAYVPAINTESRLYRVDRDGGSEVLDIRPDRYSGITVSPDGRNAALEVRNPGDDEIWLYDLARGTTTRLSQADSEQSPTWHPDGQAVTVTARDGGRSALSLKQLGGRERELAEITSGEGFLRNSAWHPDGRRLAVTRQSGGEHDLLLLHVDADDEADIRTEPLLVGQTNDHSPRFSPDGRWLAYVSRKTGAWQVYIRRFPEGEEWIASTGDQAFLPEWNRDGSELYFWQANNSNEGDALHMTAVSVTEDSDTLAIGQPLGLFPLRLRNPQGEQESYAIGSINGGRGYGLLPDGRFLMARGPSGIHQQEIVLVQNWFSELPPGAP
ncbi:MAG: hypothetical protein WDZ52_00480 [Pseudohongiellaceae bacterium]